MIPGISVIIPTKDRPDYLHTAVRSAKNGSIKPVEIIIIDDGSRTGLARWVAYNESVRYIFQESRGTSAAINEGIKASRGTWIKYLSDDDFLEPNGLSDLYATARALNLDYVYSDYYKVNSQGKRIAGIAETRFKYAGDLLSALWDHHIGNGSSTLIKRQVFDEIGYFDESLKMAEEYDFILRAGFLGKLRIGLCMVPTVNYRIHEGQKSIEKEARALSVKRRIKNKIDFIMSGRDPIGWRNMKYQYRLDNRAGPYETARRTWHGILTSIPEPAQFRIIEKWLRLKNARFA